MLVSCLCVCHNKPNLAQEAIQSIVNQSYAHWEALIVDSGVLYDAGYYDPFAWRQDQRVMLIRSNETDEIRRTKAMAPWCYNECFRKGLVHGDLIIYLCDDDILYRDAFATFVSYCAQNPHAKAMYASQDVAVIYPNGWRAIVGERRATRPGGKFCNGRQMDCHVDYLQFCHKAEVLRLLPPSEYWPEEKASESHADGIFMERIGEYVAIEPIDVKVSQNRRTPQSTNVPVRTFTMIECMANGIPFPPSQAVKSPKSTTTPLEDMPLVTISVPFTNVDGWLPKALASVAAQTYPNVEVLVLADRCAKDEMRILEAMRSRYSRFRFLQQVRADGGTMGDRGLGEACGVYFLALDAGTIACPDMLERFVAEMRRRPGICGMTCYVLALRQPERGTSAAVAPLVSTKNIYSSGIFHTASFRDVGGYGTEQQIAGQDWIGFLRLVNAGYRVDLLPEHLIYSRLGETGSVPSQAHWPDERVLRPFFKADRAVAAERTVLWSAMAGMQDRLELMQRRLEELVEQNHTLQTRCSSLRYRFADRLALLGNRLPFAKQSLQWLLGHSSGSSEKSTIQLRR
jgi:glycosyltransferase involved in cell wall biosynthesis